MANNKIITAVGKGDVCVQALSSEGKPVVLTLHDVFLVPSLANNIFSTNRFVHAGAGHSVELGADNKVLRMPTTTLPLISEHGLVWLITTLQGKQPPSASVSVPAPSVT